ncbi:unnamed protein product [Cylicocyclus nassatus]|uniref:Uncharacterized protein n=1 Tax=Cylicocyclus nassatus TaxID=53992 RepID=A0AA36MBU0_CYLNA|nr:unnamed protein product [Cylicocyclus nassatus]
MFRATVVFNCYRQNSFRSTRYICKKCVCTTCGNLLSYLNRRYGGSTEGDESVCNESEPQQHYTDISQIANERLLGCPQCAKYRGSRKSRIGAEGD